LAENLDQIEKEMKEVVTNFQTQKLNDDLVKKQDKILSKLLDAQKSINERDYEKERKSTSGKDFNLTSPPDIILSTEEGRDKLKDELMKSIREGYKKDYEELIKKYFNSLENENSNELKK
jgi:predicted metal-dependent hydrolase